MRAAILRALAAGRVNARTVIDDALVGFESAIAHEFGSGVRTALLFMERDRIARELRAFVEGRLAFRLSGLRRNEILALGRRAAPFDALVRNRRGARYGIALRRLPGDARRLELLRRLRVVAITARTPLDGVLVYDFGDATVRLLRQAGTEGVYGDLRAS